MNRKGSILTPIIDFEYSELFKMNTTNGLEQADYPSGSVLEHDFDHVGYPYNDSTLK